MSDPVGTMTAKPATTISLADFIEKADKEGCNVFTNELGTFIGEPGSKKSLTYPHIHVWKNGNIALSIAKSINTKVGKNESIDIQDLYEASQRFAIGAGRLRNTIGWVFASAS
jgi:hypothetical protein